MNVHAPIRSAGSPASAATLASMIDAQTEVLDELVAATQAQIGALIELRVHRDGGAALAARQSETQRLTRRLEEVAHEVKQRALILTQELGLPPGARTLTELAFALPFAQRADVLDRISALRSVGQALAELQFVAQAHAQRGLQAVAAWRNVLGVPDHGAGATYTRRGRARPQHTTPVPALSVDWDV